MKNLTMKATAKLFIAIEELKAKLNETRGDVGQWVLILVIGGVLVLTVGGILLKFFPKAAEEWLNKLSSSVTDMFKFI